MSDDCDRFWASAPEEAWEPIRILILEALRVVGVPLSAIQLVDVLDGEVSMWEAAEHLSALADLRVVEPARRNARAERSGESGFDKPYQVTGEGAGDDE